MNKENEDSAPDHAGHLWVIVLCVGVAFSIVISLVDAQTRKALAAMLLVVGLSCIFYSIASVIRRARLNMMSNDNENKNE